MTDTLTQPETAPADSALTISIAATGQPEASVKLSWCLNKALVEELKNTKAPKPQLLISIVSESAGGRLKETARYVVPITLGTRYVSFSRSGLNSVRAMVVWDAAGEVTKLKRTLLSRYTNGGYEQDVLAYESTEFIKKLAIDGSIGNSAGSNACTVQVPEAMFAKEPPKWLQQYIGKFVRGNAFDQCHFRRRTIAGLLSMIVVLPALFVFRLLSVAVLGLLGIRGINPKPVLHLFSTESYGVWRNSKQKSVWIHKKNGEERIPPFFAINPPVILLGSLVLFVVSSWHVTRGERVVPNLGWSYLQCLGIAAAGAVALVAVIASVFGIAFGFAWLFNGTLGKVIAPEARRKRRIAKDEAAQREHQAAIAAAMMQAPQYLTGLEALVCGNGPKPTVLPHTKREALSLWLDNTKHKVCKPYQR